MTGFLVDVFCQEKNTFKTCGGPLVGIGMGDIKFCGDGGDDFGGGFRDDALILAISSEVRMEGMMRLGNCSGRYYQTVTKVTCVCGDCFTIDLGEVGGSLNSDGGLLETHVTTR